MSSSSTMTTADDHHQGLGISEEKPAQNFPFLHLTRDLRNLVYIQLLKGHAIPPPSLSDVSQRRRTEQKCGTLSRIVYPSFPPKTSSAPSLALLLVNHQVHGEVKEVLLKRRLQIRPLTYRLDCMATYRLDRRMAVQDEELYPTWLSVPVLSSYVDVVEANLRLCGEGRGWQGWVGRFGSRERFVANPPDMIWSLLSLLKRFLKRGPDFLCKSPKSRSTTIGLLVLNVVTRTPERVMSVEAEGSEFPFEDIVLWIGKFIWMLLLDGSGKEVREKVRTIRVCLDGQERRTFDVSEAVTRYQEICAHYRERWSRYR